MSQHRHSWLIHSFACGRRGTWNQSQRQHSEQAVHKHYRVNHQTLPAHVRANLSHVYFGASNHHVYDLIRSDKRVTLLPHAPTSPEYAPYSQFLDFEQVQTTKPANGIGILKGVTGAAGTSNTNGTSARKASDGNRAQMDGCGCSFVALTKGRACATDDGSHCWRMCCRGGDRHGLVNVSNTGRDYTG